MRIVLVVSEFPALSETFIVRKFLGLLERGFDVHVFCYESDPEDWEHFPQLDSSLKKFVHITWRHRPKWLAALLTPISLIRGLFTNPQGTIKYLKKGFRLFGLNVFRRFYLDAELVILDPSIIHFEFGALAVSRSYLPKLLDSKMIVSFRGYDLNKTGLQNSRFYDDTWKKADALHLLGNGLWERALKRGCPEQKLHKIIPPAIDPKIFSKVQKNYDGVSDNPKFRILSVGRLEWEKGYQYSVQAVSFLCARGIDCEYHIIGGGSYFDGLSLAITQLGITDRVKLLNAQPPDRVMQEMLWADVLLHGAVSEGFCNAVLEAQAIGLSVVCSDAGGLPENVANDETGFVVPRRDPRALAEKLEMLAVDPPLRKKMGEAGRKRAFERFLLKDQISAFVNLYEEVLRKGAGPKIKALQNPSPSAHLI